MREAARPGTTSVGSSIRHRSPRLLGRGARDEFPALRRSTGTEASAGSPPRASARTAAGKGTRIGTSDDSEQIRALIERWAAAVHRGGLTEVTADHADDIVMFDVPPPYKGVRGLAAYRKVWPPFFAWQAQGACFEIEELEVTAGEDVAFAFALLRCGTEEELAERPEFRMRLTLGLRKEEGRWAVAHEHHSFPDLHGPDEQAQAEREVRAVHQHWFDRTATKDLDGLMSHIAEDIVSTSTTRRCSTSAGTRCARRAARAWTPRPAG
ncbi:nuclear transport factor 2 family protein [Stenotrophomonas sp. NPDC087984]